MKLNNQRFPKYFTTGLPHEPFLLNEGDFNSIVRA